MKKNNNVLFVFSSSFVFLRLSIFFLFLLLGMFSYAFAAVPFDSLRSLTPSELLFVSRVQPPPYCDILAASVEKEYNIPQGLLSAISLIESGRGVLTPLFQSSKKSKKKLISYNRFRSQRFQTSKHSWPWTVQADGHGYYLSTQKKAQDVVRYLMRHGVYNIDVGCMQINLYQHPTAFQNLNNAFNVVKNLRYAARYLVRLKKVHRTWDKAVEHYHSRFLLPGRHYLRLVKSAHRRWFSFPERNDVVLFGEESGGSSDHVLLRVDLKNQ